MKVFHQDITHWLEDWPEPLIGRDADDRLQPINRAARSMPQDGQWERLLEAVDSHSPPRLISHAVGERQYVYRHQSLGAHPDPDADLRELHLLRDVTREQRARAELAENERLVRLLIDACPDVIVIKDAAGRWLLANQSALDLFHLEGLPWWGRDDDALAELTDPGFRDVFYHCRQSDHRAWAARESRRTTEVVISMTGEEHVFDVIKRPVFNADGARHALIVIARDITTQLKTQAEYEDLAIHDELTHLYNRRFFQIEAQRRLEEFGRENRGAAVVMLDIDRFRTINDCHGHDPGDQVIRQTADRLRELGARQDWLVARLSGDEFAILAGDLDARDGLEVIGHELRELMRRSFELETSHLSLTASGGIAYWPAHSRHISQLLSQADAAMFEAKKNEREPVAEFSPRLSERQLWRSEMLGALRESLENDRFHLVYQIQQDALGLAVTGVESLLRWDAPDPQLQCGPQEFIPFLEQSGLIVEVGGWVMTESACQAARWGRETGQPVTVSVNVSSVQLHAPCFADRVARALEISGLPPALLELELTESALVHDPEQAATTLGAVRDLGVRLALDDFGTGYSSLSYLKRFSFDRLKIDQGFVRDILGDRNDLEIVKAIIAMGNALSLEIIAEGVETTDQRDLLDSLGCHSFQGYLIGRPACAETIRPLLGVRLL
ncbi:MAG: EAL domain-containing protein [Halothiobacillaceae bacterium]|nr:EAL domain-containing protein [Halothiobacillaceae bacterium]HER34197.1 GGDEF and EAL domain-containing protein [Halothiobacillaceae bacterium]